MTATSAPYSVRQIIERYESEEEEFVRELEEMRRNLPKSDNEEIPQDPAPILSVLCSLVDEIGSLRTENRHLKTRLAPSPSRARNMVHRVSAIFDGRSNILPKLRKSGHTEIRMGARERLSTPPRKDCFTTSSISTDGDRAPPLVEPELSDSDLDENIFSDGDSSECARHSRRISVRRRDMSLSECTSPSSASSSRDPSEAMSSSRSSFFEVFGFRKRRSNAAQTTLPPVKHSQKKRKRRLSQEESHFMCSTETYRIRQKPPRPSSYYPREDSEDSDHMRTRKAASFLSVENAVSGGSRFNIERNRETRLIHEKDNLNAEIEELKMRNQRLVEQLRGKSVQFSKLQVHVNKLEQQVHEFENNRKYSEQIEKMTLDERVYRAPLSLLDKIEEQLQNFERQMQAARMESAANAQKALNITSNERATHQQCLLQLDRLQKENFCLLRSHYIDDKTMESTTRRKLELLPSYEALFAFTNKMMQKIREMRHALIERDNEITNAEMDLLSAQATLLVTQTQIDRLELQNSERKRKPKRAASYHGEPYSHRLIKPQLRLLLPLRAQARSMQNQKKLRKNKSNELNDHSFEEEFLHLYNTSRGISFSPQNYVPMQRIEYMIREMERQKPKNFSPVAEKNEVSRKQDKRPISMAEVEEELRVRKLEDVRKLIKVNKDIVEPSLRKPTSRSVITSLQNVNELPSPNSTPLMLRRSNIPERVQSMRVYDFVGEVPHRATRKVERGFSTESSPNERREEIGRTKTERDERRTDEKRQSQVFPSRIQRSQPVQLSRIRPPSSSGIQSKGRTIGPPRVEAQLQPQSIKLERSSTLESNDVREAVVSRIQKPDKRSWIDKIKAMRKN